jgi:rare lipoprotein A
MTGIQAWHLRHGRPWRLAALAALVGLSACGGASEPEAALPAAAPVATGLGAGDIEAPELFQASDRGLWDGRPSIGGIWVAHPDVGEPHRVVIRVPATGASVIGALFRRERDLAGPPIQVSSEAAEALGLLAGAPAALTVTALRREGEAAAPAAPVVGLAEAQALDVPTTAGAGALPPGFVVVGLFDEEGALAASAALAAQGLPAAVETLADDTTWRVIVGPAPDPGQAQALLDAVRAAGYPDATLG